MRIDAGLTIYLRDSTTLRSVQFGSSLLGSFTGYPTHRGAERILREALQRSRQEDAAQIGPVRVPKAPTLLRPLLFLAAVYASFLVAFAFAWSIGR